MALELVLRARHCLSLGRLDAAEALARQAAREPALAADALHLVGVVHLRRGRPEAAETALRQAIERDGKVAAFHNDLGNALQDRGRLNEAIAAYRRALRLHPTLAEAWNDLGTARYAKGELESAVECYQRALRLRPDHIVAHANLGAVYRKLGLLGDARRALQRELILRLKQAMRSLWPRRLDLGSAKQLCALAQAQLDAGNPRQGMAIAQRALELEAQSAEALCLISAAHLRLGASGPALEAALRARPTKPRAPHVQQQLGASFAAAGRLEEAAAAFEEALALQPAPETLAALGELRLRRGDAPAAESVLRQALARRPQDPALHTALGEARHRQRSPEEAEAAYRRALVLDAQHLTAHIRLSELLRETDRIEEAEAVARAALAVDDESPAAHLTLGMAHKAKGRLKKARECFERALELSPNHVQAMQQIALALREEDRLDDAEKHLRAALRVRPNEPVILADLGMILADQMRYAEALQLFDRALELAPHFVVAINRKALLVDHLGDPMRSLELLREALKLSPDDAYAQYNVGLHHLKHGDYAQGWDGYEQRRSFDSFIGKYRRFALPEWQSESLQERVLLVLPEQGLGDEIMFGSCLPDAAAQARHVIVECDQKLEAILRRSFPACTVVSRLRTLENDWINRIEPKPQLLAAAGSLARRFRRRAADFPQRAFLHAAPEAVAAWRAKLDALGPGRKIGLSWSGGTGFTGKKRRSFSLEDLLPILRLPGLQFVNLQYTDVREEMRALEQRHSIRLQHWQEAIDDYDQTAALVCALEGVVTVCTAIVHLSGALGRPALVMVPFGADWRYGASGERMVWYPSVRLLRQQTVGEWGGVLQEVSRRLQAGAWQ